MQHICSCVQFSIAWHLSGCLVTLRGSSHICLSTDKKYDNETLTNTTGKQDITIANSYQVVWVSCIITLRGCMVLFQRVCNWVVCTCVLASASEAIFYILRPLRSAGGWRKTHTSSLGLLIITFSWTLHRSHMHQSPLAFFLHHHNWSTHVTHIQP